MPEGLLKDLRYAGRLLTRSPGFAVVAILTLALGIGASTTIFSVANAVILRPLPFPHAERLVWMWGEWGQGSRASVSPPDFLDYRADTGSFERFAAMTSFLRSSAIGGEGDPEMVQGSLVSSEFFETLGWSPALGRGFIPSDEQMAIPEVVVLSDSLWRRRFGADPAAIGRAIVIDGAPRVIAGVMPPGFDFPRGADVWQPLPFRSGELQHRRSHFLRPIGRLKPGISIETAQAEISSIAERLAQEHPDSNRTWSLLLVPLAEPLIGSTRPALLILTAAVAAVLLIACANLANLLLGRATARGKEIAIRAALGASRSRLVRQLLTENLLLAACGGTLGLLLALWGVDLLRVLGPADLPRLDQVSIDGTVLAFASLLSIITGLLFGLAPSIQTARAGLQEALKEGGRTSSVPSRRRLRGALAISEVALSVVLLIGAGLLAKSLWRLLEVDPGFSTERILTTRVTLPESRYARPEQRGAFVGAVLDRLKALPGVAAAATASQLPLSGQENDTNFTVEGRPPLPVGRTLNANIRVVSPDYFGALEIRRVRGRGFGPEDTLESPGVVIINEPMARSVFPDEDPLGRVLVIETGQQFRAEIIGIVNGIRHHGLEFHPQPEMYLSHAQSPRLAFNLVVRGQGDTAALAGAIRSAVLEIDDDQPVSEFVTMDWLLARSVAAPWFRTTLLGLFAALALLLSAIGLYGVMSFTVSQRVHEIGVRMALGASRREVLGLILAQGMRLTLAGVAIGLFAAFGLARVVSSLLFGVSASDPLTFIGVPIALTGVALAACWIPARRAARVDPLVALRCE